MCNESDREIIRIDFQVIDLKKQQEGFEVNSSEYQMIQNEIDGLLERLKEIKQNK